jgi:hypothetical protein
MAIIELYKDKPNTLWQNDETFLCVFDNNENLIMDYDFCTGLKLVQGDDYMSIYINEDDLIPGKWKLFATKTKIINNEHIKKRVKAEGIKKENVSLDSVSNKNLSNNECGPGEYVSKKERESRLSICKTCPFFDKENIICTVDKKIVLKSTKYKNEYCPKEKWGNKEEFLQKLIESGTIPVAKINKEEQEAFELELEEYLKGK